MDSDTEERYDPIRSNTALPSDLPSRSLNFVRSRMRHLQAENDTLRQELASCSKKLAVINTAQSWAMEHAGTPDSPWTTLQAQKIRQVERLLTKAVEAQDNYSALITTEDSSSIKSTLAKFRAENKDMRERLRRACERGKELQEENKRLRAQAADAERKRAEKLPNEILAKTQQLESLGKSMAQKIRSLHLHVAEPKK